MTVTIEDVRAAAARIRGQVVRTPLLPCLWAESDRPLWLKPESLQATGAFKVRGAFSAVSALFPRERARGVITHSSGNHAQALALAARTYDTTAVIVMPDSTPPVKIEATRRLGAEIVLVPAAERESRVAMLQAERGLVLVPPFDHPDVIAGQGTVGLEIGLDLPDVDVVLVPVSGGGLISGIAVALATLAPRAKVIAVEPELAADLREGFHRGERVVWDAALTGRTIADGLRVPAVGHLPWQLIKEYVHDVVTVSEDEIREAVRVLAHRCRLVAEPSGAVATAAYLFRAGALPAGRTVCVVSGGNVDPDTFVELLRGGG